MEEFGGLCKGYSSAVVKRCFAFAPGDTQVVVSLFAFGIYISVKL